jgi:hypothetical protein
LEVTIFNSNRGAAGSLGREVYVGNHLWLLGLNAPWICLEQEMYEKVQAVCLNHPKMCAAKGGALAC